MKRPALRTALAGVAALVAAACGAAPAAQETAVPIPFETVLDQAHSGLDTPLREVVRDEGRWAALWTVIHGRVSPQPPLPPVDFSRHMLIAVALGTRRSSGFEVEVRSVAAREGRLEVEVLETCPAPDELVGMTLTQPVQVIQTEKFPQEAAFLDVRAPACE